MQRSYRLLITTLLSVFVLYKLLSVGGKYTLPSGPSSWSKAHPESESDKHKEVIAGVDPVHDRVSEHKVAENALDALPGALPPALPPSMFPPFKKPVLANATFVTLARNGDLKEIVKSIRNVEDRFNRNYHYPWVFLNDVEFDDEFKRVTTAHCSGKVEYGLIPTDHWGMPDWIDKEKAAAVRKEMGEKKIIYGDSESYRYMCRYESGFFYRHPLMMKYEYYWRVEPSIEMYCDVDYDPFVFMKENNKVYGFVISLYEYHETITTLWDTTKKFMEKFPDYLPKNNLLDWLSDDGGDSYNRCHFWSNFEIAKLDFWRKGAYAEYFDHLDQSGGFFYERWGDAPIHSIGAALFAEQDQIHFFGDMGYYHVPFTHCPVDPKYREKCHCDVKESFDWRGYSCTPKYFDIMKLDKPDNYKDFTD